MRLPAAVYGSARLGNVIDSPRFLGMTDAVGNELLKDASIEIKSIEDEQPDPTKPSVEMAKVQFTCLTPDGKRKTFTVSTTTARLDKDFEGFVREMLPDAQIDARADRLLAVVIGHSVIGLDHRVPVMTEDYWTNEQGWFYRGKRLSDAPVEIVNEKTTSTGETIYRLRMPSGESGNYAYTDATWDELNRGSYAYRLGSALRISAPISLSMALRSRYAALSENDKKRLVQDEYEQRKREYDAKLATRFHINGRFPSE